jgi:hypothetical protein
MLSPARVALTLGGVVAVCVVAWTGWPAAGPPLFKAADVHRLRVVCRDPDGAASQTFATTDPTLIAAVAAVIAAARPDERCACGALGSIVFDRAGGLDALTVYPAHGMTDVQFEWNGRRYAADRGPLLRALEPLGVAPVRLVGS